MSACRPVAPAPIPLLLCVAWLLVLPAAAQDLPPLNAYASRHYHIHTNLSRLEAVPFGRHMDTVYDRYAERFAGYRVSPNARPMPLYLFRTRQQYLDFLEHHDIAGRGSGGMFFVTHRLQGLATWTEGHPPSQTFRTLQHEGFHQFAWHHLGRQLPTWINEGLAQYFEDAVFLESGMVLGLGDPHRIALVQDALDVGYALETRDLISLSSRQWSHTLNTNASRSELLYAQAWSIVYFMIHGDDGRYLRSFEVYLRLISDGLDHPAAFRAAFGDDAIEEIDRGWRRFARHHRPDAVRTAADRLTFLGSALSYQARRGETLPRDFVTLRSDLQQRRFTLTRSLHGMKHTLSAEDDRMFGYTRPGGAFEPFLLLEPAAAGLPPRLVAPGLSPEPSLVWHFDDRGRPEFDIVYR